MSDARVQIGSALNDKLSPEQVRFLMDEVLAITKQGWGSCKECNHRVLVDIPDARAVTSSLTDLLNQAWGRPSEVAKEDQGLVVNRKVVLANQDEDEIQDVNDLDEE